MALQNTEAFQHSRRLRKKVEMLFAHMKQPFRFTRLKLRGLAGAAEEFYWWRLFKICVVLYGSVPLRSRQRLVSRPHDGKQGAKQAHIEAQNRE